MLSRRKMLWGSTSALLLSACAGNPTAKRAMADAVALKRAAGQPAVGIQTYTIREAMAVDARAALQMLKDVGYDFIEANDRDFTRIPLAEFKAIVDEVGLPIPATHVGFSTLIENPQEVADKAAALGVDYAVLSWTDEAYRSTAGYTDLADRFNGFGDIMAASGLTFGYHNHQFEFWPIDGPRTGMEIYLEETDPDKVTFELDFFWAALARQDVPALFRKHPGRFKLCHIKDMDTARLAEVDNEGNLDFDAIKAALMVNVGEGDLDLESWLRMSDVSGIEYLIAEHDEPPAPVRDSVATSLRTIRGYAL